MGPGAAREVVMARILIIDDDERVLRSLGRLLTAEGYEVETAAGGALAMKAFERNAADLVITDINMPEMDGIEVITTLQDLHPAVPIIAISAGGLFPKELLLQNADMLGAIATITKPFDIDTLLEAVADALAGDGSMDDVTP